MKIAAIVEKCSPFLLALVATFALAMPVSAEQSQSEPSEQEKPAVGSQFRFGSYGRARAATDLRGRSARPVNIVSFGSRIDERGYAELEFQQRFFRPAENPRFDSQVVATIAFGDDLFHYTGRFDQSIAIRNLYARLGWRMAQADLALWGGSRMVRGDDIYLLDFWPLDHLNLLGGGAELRLNHGLGPLLLGVHGGVNRLHDPFQYQQVEVPGLRFGSEEVVVLDRQRFIASGRAEQQLWLDDEGKRGVKAVFYAESQHLAEGARLLEDGVTAEVLAADRGFLVGGQLGFWEGTGSFFDGSFANLFLRYSTGLASYGELGVPFQINHDETSAGARDFLAGLSAAGDTPFGNLIVGSYLRTFHTAAHGESFEDYWEAIIAARVHGYLTDHIHPGVELSHQVRRPRGVYPEADDYERPQLQVPTVTKLSAISAFSLEPGAYARPQLRLIYSASFLNDSARALYRPEDRRRELAVQHYLGLMVEWWFNSSSY